MISAIEIKGGIEDLAMPPVSHPAGVPRGGAKKNHSQHVVVRRVNNNVHVVDKKTTVCKLCYAYIAYISAVNRHHCIRQAAFFIGAKPWILAFN